jgi:hypothetical protein
MGFFKRGLLGNQRGESHGTAYQVIKFDGGHSLIDTRDDFLCDSSGINVLCVQAITEPRNTSGDLVELNALLAAV